jgi:hypothetical protein
MADSSHFSMFAASEIEIECRRVAPQKVLAKTGSAGRAASGSTSASG